MTVRGVQGFVGYSGAVAGSTADVGVRLQGRVQSNGAILLQGQRWWNEGGVLDASGGALYVNGAQVDNQNNFLRVLGGNSDPLQQRGHRGRRGEQHHQQPPHLHQ